MSYSMALPDRSSTNRPRLRRRLVIHVVVLVARVLATLPPGRLRRVLARVCGPARPAGPGDAERWYTEVTACSARCAGWRGCLPRSISICLLARLEGTWPHWCAGVVATPPFAAHAWVEAGDQIIGDPGRPGDYRALLRVSPQRTASR
jgi:hypothetical protein